MLACERKKMENEIAQEVLAIMQEASVNQKS